MKINTIEKEQFDAFAKKHKYRNYYQTSTYASIMSNFNYEISYIGIYNEEDKLVGASVLLLQNAFMKNKIAYAPRGILFDFTDKKDTMELVEALKNDLGKKGILSLRMDPAVPITVRDNKGNIINVNNEANAIMKNLKEAGFSYKGQNLYFETEKPRWEAISLLQKDIRDIYKTFDKRCRNKINKAIKCGIEVYRDDEKDITQLYDFIKRKEKKPFKYFKEICDKFAENADVFYAKLNTEQFVINSKKLYEDELDKNEKISKKFQELAQKKENKKELFNQKVISDKLLNVYKSNLIFATNVLKENPNGLIIGGGINIIYDNAAFMITEGFDPKYVNLNSNYLLKWRMLCSYKTEKLKYFNLGAITGNFDKKNKYAKLNETKLGFNCAVTEYIGEYDIILNNFKYNLYKNLNKK